MFAAALPELAHANEISLCPRKRRQQTGAYFLSDVQLQNAWRLRFNLPRANGSQRERSELNFLLSSNEKSHQLCMVGGAFLVRES